MTLMQWALPKLAELLPLDEPSLKSIIEYTDTLPDSEAVVHLTGLLGDTPEAAGFISSFEAHRSTKADAKSTQPSDVDDMPPAYAPPPYATAQQSTSMFLRRAHSNPVIDAANIRARDEVCLILAAYIRLLYSIRSNFRPARDAARAAEPSTAIWHLQQRDRA